MSFTLAQKNAAAGTGNIASLTNTLNGVVAGDLVIVAFSAYNPSGYTFTCSDGHNAYTTGPSLLYDAASGIYLGSFWTVATTGGTLPIVITSSTATALASGVNEFSAAAGSTFVLTSSNTGNGPTAAPVTGNLTWGATGNILVWGAASDSGTGLLQGNLGGSTPTTLGNKTLYSASNHFTEIDEYVFISNNVPASPQQLHFGGTETSLWVAAAMVFTETAAAASTASGAALLPVM